MDEDHAKLGRRQAEAATKADADDGLAQDPAESFAGQVAFTRFEGGEEVDVEQAAFGFFEELKHLTGDVAVPDRRYAQAGKVMGGVADHDDALRMQCASGEAIPVSGIDSTACTVVGGVYDMGHEVHVAATGIGFEVC